MSKPMIRIHNIETNEIIDREMTAAEFKKFEADQLADAKITIEIEAKDAARQEILDRLGITADEAKLILG
jgi:hypothetical protein